MIVVWVKLPKKKFVTKKLKNFYNEGVPGRDEKGCKMDVDGHRPLEKGRLKKAGRRRPLVNSPKCWVIFYLTQPQLANQQQQKKTLGGPIILRWSGDFLVD